MQDKITSVKDIFNLMENIKGIAPKHCDLCGAKYEENDYHLVKTEHKQSIVHLKCRSCSNSYMLNIYSPGFGIVGSARSQLNLDLSDSKELVTFAGSQPITMNQALDAYNTILKTESLDKFIKKAKPQMKFLRRSKVVEENNTTNV